MTPFRSLTSRAVPLLVDDIDTDQIIPARFLTVTDKRGLGERLFADWRYGPDGTPDPEFVLNRKEHRGASILLGGRNFGCGSSREHAPWALAAYGFRAVIAPSFADIFQNNALKNGLLPVRLSGEDHRRVAARVARDPGMELTVDLVAQHLLVPGEHALTFPIDPFARTCLVEGVDELGYMLRFLERIEAFEKQPRE